jgi:hypothetical protein
LIDKSAPSWGHDKKTINIQNNSGKEVNKRYDVLRGDMFKIGGQF